MKVPPLDLGCSLPLYRKNVLPCLLLRLLIPHLGGVFFNSPLKRGCAAHSFWSGGAPFCDKQSPFCQFSWPPLRPATRPRYRGALAVFAFLGATIGPLWAKGTSGFWEAPLPSLLRVAMMCALPFGVVKLFSAFFQLFLGNNKYKLIVLIWKTMTYKKAPPPPDAWIRLNAAYKRKAHSLTPRRRSPFVHIVSVGLVLRSQLILVTARNNALSLPIRCPRAWLNGELHRKCSSKCSTTCSHEIHSTATSSRRVPPATSALRRSACGASPV